jgi:predicted nucleic-acid-binding protein
VIAVDTNVVIRLLTQDDPRQGPRAQSLFRMEEIWLPKTVLLEAEWVLRSLYKFPSGRTVDALQRLVALPNVHVEDAAAVIRALDWAAQGMDFADTLHLASKGASTKFLTWDSNLVKRARRAGVTSVGLL